MDDLLIPLASAILSGGLIAAFTSAYAAKKKVPVERDAIAVSGAETAVLSLERSLKAETSRADRAEAENVRLTNLVADRDARIAALENRLDEAQVALDSMRQELHAIVTDSKNQG